tara:strand:- start:73 stop:609 length:537 start_codon:yes stop_codon:yes gene_type:complete
MDTAINILSDEHQNILKVIDALLEECNALESGKEIDKDFFKKTIAFVRGYADKFHHAKEEDILFVELGRNDVQMHCDPTQQMLYEHDLGRNFIKELEKGIKGNNQDKILENARGYSQLLQEHIFKEDNVLYPMADEVLSQQMKKIMLDKFKEVEQKLSQEKKKYPSFIKELAEKNQDD